MLTDVTNLLYSQILLSIYSLKQLKLCNRDIFFTQIILFHFNELSFRFNELLLTDSITVINESTDAEEFVFKLSNESQNVVVSHNAVQLSV